MTTNCTDGYCEVTPDNIRPAQQSPSSTATDPGSERRRNPQGAASVSRSTHSTSTRASAAAKSPSVFPVVAVVSEQPASPMTFGVKPSIPPVSLLEVFAPSPNPGEFNRAGSSDRAEVIGAARADFQGAQASINSSPLGATLAPVADASIGPEQIDQVRAMLRDLGEQGASPQWARPTAALPGIAIPSGDLPDNWTGNPEDAKAKGLGGGESGSGGSGGGSNTATYVGAAAAALGATTSMITGILDSNRRADLERLRIQSQERTRELELRAQQASSESDRAQLRAQIEALTALQERLANTHASTSENSPPQSSNTGLYVGLGIAAAAVIGAIAFSRTKNNPAPRRRSKPGNGVVVQWPYYAPRAGR